MGAQLDGVVSILACLPPHRQFRNVQKLFKYLRFVKAAAAATVLSVLPTVAEVLGLPVVDRGNPMIRGGYDRLDRKVRWVHVSDLEDLSELVQGGELVLTTGRPLAGTGTRSAEYLQMLVEANVSGLVVELGGYVHEIPESLANLADELGLPLITLSNKIRFVEVTEVVHRRIVAEQYEELEFARNIHERFTALSVKRAGIAEILGSVANILESSVVLENLSHHASEFVAVHQTAAELLDQWEMRSRTASLKTGPDADPGWTSTAVGPHGLLWGRLVVPSSAKDKSRIRTVLERAAQALTLCRMIDTERQSLEQYSQRGFISDLVHGRLDSEVDATARAASLGLRTGGAYLPFVVHTSLVSDPDPIGDRHLDMEIRDAVAYSLGSVDCSALVSPGGNREVRCIIALRESAIGSTLETASVAVKLSVGRVVGVRDTVVGVGSESLSLIEAAATLAEASHVAGVAMSLGDKSRAFFRSPDIRLRGLISLISEYPHVQRFAEAELGKLIAYDISNETTLVDTLSLFLELAGNKTELAKRMITSRPTLYAQLAKIEKVLHVSLDDGESRTSLHAAILLMEASRRVAR